MTTASSIFDELCMIDPSFRERKKEILPLIEQLLATRPDVKPDPAFVAQLRRILVERAASGAGERHASFFSLFTMTKYTYAVAGVVLGILVAVPVTRYFTAPGSPGTPTALRMNSERSASPLFGFNVKKEGDRAFGPLQNVTQGSAALGKGGGGGGIATDSSVAPGIASPQGKIAPEWTMNEYVYKGTLPELPKSVDVLRREKGSGMPDLAAVVSDFNVGLLDLTTFRGSKVDSINFSQPSSYGYVVSVAFADGSVNISQNWSQWPHPEANCRDEECARRYRVKPEDIPSDDTLLTIAKDFVTAHRIDLSHYGTPEIDKSWKPAYDAADDKNTVYIPESQRVLFPLLVDDKPVYDMGGQKMGISVGVSVREKKVSDVSGIQNQTYGSSAYDGVGDTAAVTAYLKNLERPPEAAFKNPNVKVRTVELGEPVLGYGLYYQSEGMTMQELIVPALIFKVETPPADPGTYSRSYVTVPLAKEMLQKPENRLMY